MKILKINFYHLLFKYFIFLISFSSFNFLSIELFSLELKDFLTGRYNPKFHNDFILIPKKYTINSPVYLQKEVYKAFINMHYDAKKENIELKIVSGTRTYNQQNYIWTYKWNNSKYKDDKLKVIDILNYTAIPGTSRHHWGTDIDINSTEDSYFKTEKGQKEYNWLKNNAYKYGFFQPYKEKIYRKNKGYNEEKWHWSYYPLSNKYLKLYLQIITYDDLTNSYGYKHYRSLNIIEDYVSNINYEINSFNNKIYKIN